MSIQTELLAIKQDQELLTAEEVVEWAQAHPRSDLHKQFEWDDTKAASEYRLWQARRVIALNVTEGDGTRKFVSLSVDRSREGGGYRDIDDVLRNKSLYDIMMDDALRELERVQEKYDDLKELEPLWKEVARVRRQQGKEKRASA
jgi:hypothetical protein